MARMKTENGKRETRNPLFGDRGAWLRVGLVAAGLVGMTAYSEMNWKWEMPDPDIKDCLADPARYDERVVWLGPARVTAVTAEGFTAEDMRDAPVRVQAPTGLVQEGEQVIFRGIFHATRGREGPAGYVALDEHEGRAVLRKTSSGIQKRYGMFAVSVGVLGYLAWRMARTFRIAGGLIDLRSPVTNHKSPLPR